MNVLALTMTEVEMLAKSYNLKLVSEKLSFPFVSYRLGARISCAVIVQ